MKVEFFLDSVTPYGIRDWPEAERSISNWVKAAKIIYAEEDPKVILRLLQVELSTQRRRMLIERIYSRYSYLRAAEEHKTFMDRFEKRELPENPILKDILHSWDYTHVYISGIELEPLPRILELMEYEYCTKARRYLLQRLQTKYQSIRRALEKRDMYIWKAKKPLNGAVVS